MRIAMISGHASPLAAAGGEDTGGQNTHVAELSAALAADGHDVRVYTRRDDVVRPDTFRAPDGYDIVHVPAGPPSTIPKDELLPHMREFGRFLAERWRAGDWRPEVAHAHFWMSGLAGLSAGQESGVPVVLTYHALGVVKRRHQGAQDTSPRRRIAYEQALGRGVDRVIAQCQDEIRELTRMGVPRRRISLVPSGVNASVFRPDGPAVPRDPRVPRILTVGRMVERKGFQDVIAALRRVPGAELVVVGGPVEPLYSRLVRYAQACGVADRVTFAGAVPREEMPSWYRSADVVVSAPWYEPFGLTPLEAMACGVPVVASGVGGLTDTVVDGITGVLVPPRDPPALARALRDLLGDRMRRLAYGTAAVDRAHHTYSWSRAAEQLAAVYAAVGALGRPSGAVA
jgi:glycosyltransferase involved in cell wall biosynthesis